jgi:hypothetical protein
MTDLLGWKWNVPVSWALKRAVVVAAAAAAKRIAVCPDDYGGG